MAHKDYSGTPLPQKLGIAKGSRVALVGAPDGFDRALRPLPPGAEAVARARGPLDVAVLFSTLRSDLERRFGPLAKALAPAGRL